MPDPVICTCKSFGCRLKTFEDNFGQVQFGARVPSSTRKRHRLTDEATTSPLDAMPATTASSNIPSTYHIPAASDLIDHSRREETDRLETDDSEGIEFHSLKESIVMLALWLGAWLHLQCGLSRELTGKVLKILDIILTLAFRFNQLAFIIQTRTQLPTPTKPILKIPHDVRTAITRLSIEPKIIRSVCCPKCFLKYELQGLPEICSFRESPRSRPCGEPLWTTRSTRGGPCRVPCRLYNTQDFHSWLEFFLSRDGIEDLIDASYAYQPHTDGLMTSIWDSPAWKSLGPFTKNPENLTFSYYIDWFNPLTNKIAGKTVSCGAIMLFCLNLPHHLQHLPENTFFAGITPPPKEPSVTTITHVSDPIIDELEPMFGGKFVCTHRHPLGILRRVAILIAIGDLMAMRKALGFAGISAHQFCSFCDLHRQDIDNLDPSTWNLRTAVDVRRAAEEWSCAVTKKARAELLAKNGVRGSSLHRLWYRDPVQHTMLGLMHNWIEGVLQHQARVKWGIGAVSTSKDGKAEQAGEDITGTPRLAGSGSPTIVLDVDFDMLEDELLTLQSDSAENDDTPSVARHLRSEASFQSIDSFDQVDAMEEDDDDDFSQVIESDGSTSDDEEMTSWNALCIFDAAALLKIHTCLSDAAIPTWIARPPTNLGEKLHGKLKADNWFILFTVFLPMVLPEIWTSSHNSRQLALLKNFHDLVICTNIVCSYSTSNAAADDYLEHYIQYRASSKQLFPDINTRPNHHYAMHNADLLKFWGPLILLSEFPYEQHNGTLQKIKTNAHMYELDLTMLRQICRRGRLAATVQDGIHSQRPLSDAFEILFPKITAASLPVPAAAKLSPFEEAQFNRKGERLPPSIYELWLSYMNSLEQRTSVPDLFRHHKDLPHPADSRVLLNRAVPQSHLEHLGRDYSIFDMHLGNSSILYHDGDAIQIGMILSIWTQAVSGDLHTFLVASPHKPLSHQDQRRNPYTDCPGFKCQLVYCERSTLEVIIAKQSILGHVASYDPPLGSFGIKKAVRILNDSLRRGR